jgi:hypothetical protein
MRILRVCRRREVFGRAAGFQNIVHHASFLHCPAECDTFRSPVFDRRLFRGTIVAVHLADVGRCIGALHASLPGIEHLSGSLLSTDRFVTSDDVGLEATIAIGAPRQRGLTWPIEAPIVTFAVVIIVVIA